MPFMLSQEHHNFFSKNNFIEFEFLVSPKQCLNLHDEIIRTLKNNTNPKHPLIYENLHRTFSNIVELVIRNRLAYIVSELIYKKPLWLIYDKLFISPEDLLSYKISDNHDCCLFLYLNNDKKLGNGIFFKEKLPEIVDYGRNTSILLLVFTYRNMPFNCPKIYI